MYHTSEENELPARRGFSMSDHAHRFPPEKMHLLDAPERKKLMPAEKLLNMLPVRSDDTIVDLGAGTGYFSIPAAQMTDATVYAVDVEPKMLEVIKLRADVQELFNVQTTIGVIEDIPLEDGVADIVIASLVLHEVEPLSKGLHEIHRVLKTTGSLLCLDWEPKESSMGPPLEVRISSSDMEKALNEAGYTVTKRLFPGDFLYVFVATKSVL
jgi:ubiquinone/menaquinone biosynthesis C-methylase UbiE